LQGHDRANLEGHGAPGRSLWERRTIRAFAGEDIEAAVLYPEDERYLIGGESTVVQYEVIDRVEP
jgi:hypothetical protein